MNTGVLWYDDDPDRTLDKKVFAACARYAQKFGVAANTCYVHPLALGTATATVVNDVKVLAGKGMLRHNFFAVREDA